MWRFVGQYFRNWRRWLLGALQWCEVDIYRNNIYIYIYFFYWSYQILPWSFVLLGTRQCNVNWIYFMYCFMGEVFISARNLRDWVGTTVASLSKLPTIISGSPVIPRNSSGHQIAPLRVQNEIRIITYCYQPYKSKLRGHTEPRPHSTMEK